jgi:hypothetical protein
LSIFHHFFEGFGEFDNILPGSRLMGDVLNVEFVVMVGPISWWEDGVDDLFFSGWNVGIVQL